MPDRCAACGFRPVENPTTGMCAECHQRGLAVAILRRYPLDADYLVYAAQETPDRPHAAPRTRWSCSNCHEPLNGQHIDNRCVACGRYFQRNGHERPIGHILHTRYLREKAAAHANRRQD